MKIRKITDFPSPPRPTEEDPLPGARGKPAEVVSRLIERDDFRNIIVRMPNWVGDVVMAIPALKAIRDSFPEARITVLVKPHLLRILEGEPHFDANVPFRARTLREMWRLGRQLAGDRYDLALVFPNSISSALVMAFAGIPVRLGYREELRDLLGLLTHTVRSRKVLGFRQIPMVDTYLNLAYAAGCRPASRRIWFHIPEEKEAAAADLYRSWGVEEGETVVGLSPGASFGASKLWRSDHFATVADTLAREQGARILILCGPGEETVADEIEETMEEAAINTSRRIVPLDLLKPVVRRLRLLVCTDSGTRHFAVGTGVPAVVVMGSTYHLYTETEYEKYDIIHHRLDCWPCHEPVCPLGHHDCMQQIPPERVLDACRGMLERFPPSGENHAWQGGGVHPIM